MPNSNEFRTSPRQGFDSQPAPYLDDRGLDRRLPVRVLRADELRESPRPDSRPWWRIGDEVVLFGVQDLIPVTRQIVGVLGPTAPENYFIFRRDYLVEIYRHFPHRVQPEYDVDLYWIKADSVRAVPSIIAEVDESF